MVMQKLTAHSAASPFNRFGAAFSTSPFLLPFLLLLLMHRMTTFTRIFRDTPDRARRQDGGRAEPPQRVAWD